MAQITLGVLNETARQEIRAEMARQRLSVTGLATRLAWGYAYTRQRLNGPTSLSLDDIEAIANELQTPVLQLIDPRGERA